MFGFDAPKLGALAAICFASAACAAPTNDGMSGAPPPPPEIEEALSMSVEAIDVRHGSLRIEASMLDGAADVSMWLGSTCEQREVGRGIATRSSFAWSLSRDEIARVIECSLVVRVHAVDDEGRRVLRTAELPVGVVLQSDGAEESRIAEQEALGSSTRLVFHSRKRAPRLHVAGSVIGAEDGEPSTRGIYKSAFIVGNDDLARSMVGRRRLTILGGEHYLATITVGNMVLDVSEPEPPPPPEQPEQPEPQVSDSEEYGDG